MDTICYNASDARDNLYTLIRSAAKGLNPVEINLRGTEPVVIINKSEVESWLETLDILSSDGEMCAVKQGKKVKKYVTHQEMKKKLGLE